VAVVALRGSLRGSLWPASVGAYALVSLATAVALARVGSDALLRMNAVGLLVWAATTTVALAGLGQWHLHRRFNAVNFVRHNEVGGFIVAVVGSLYGVLLAFMTVIAWQHFADCTQLVAQESAAATDAWHTAVGLPRAPRVRVRHDMLAYANAMLAQEWPAMRARGFDREADWTVMDAIGAAGQFDPRSLKEANAQTATLQQLSALHDYRQRRLSENRAGISSFEWLVLIVGFACVVGFCWLFGLENATVHLMMTSAVTIMVTATLVLLFELQYPFQSDLRIQPDDWTAVVTHIQYMQSGPQASMRM
jgi:Protein of unknown function (DUF4239)